MIINADAINGYTFQIEPKDTPYIDVNFKTSITPRAGGYGFIVEDMAPDFYVKGQAYVFFDSIITGVRTYQPETKFKGLYDHGYTIDVDNNRIITLASAAIQPGYKKITTDGKLYRCDHIPQLFMMLDGNLITGVYGEYNFRNNSFFGLLNVGDL